MVSTVTNTSGPLVIAWLLVRMKLEKAALRIERVPDVGLRLQAVSGGNENGLVSVQGVEQAINGQLVADPSLRPHFRRQRQANRRRRAFRNGGDVALR